MAAPQTQKEWQIGCFEQTVYGTAAAEAAAAEIVAVSDVTFPEQGVNFREVMGNSGARYPDTADISVDQYGLLTEFTIAGNVKKACIDKILYAYFQDVVEGETPLFLKTFTMEATQPDFAADAGYFCTWWLKSPVASTSLKVVDVICKALTLTCDPGGVLTYSATMIGRGALTTNSNPTGTWTSVTNTTFNYHKTDLMTANIAGGGANTMPLSGGWKLDFQQDVSGYGDDGAGEFDAVVIDNRRITFTSNVRYDTVAQALQTALAAGSYVDVIIGWDGDGDGDVALDADGDFHLAFQMIQDKGQLQNSVPIGNQIGGLICGTSATSKAPITVSLVTGGDRTWPAT